MRRFVTCFITALLTLGAAATAQDAAKPISAEFPFEPHFVEVLGSKIHYVDEGEGDPILFLHGNPTSSYLWRNIIPYMTEHGRCIAPDLIGMGKSDKPDIDYSFFDHVKYIDGFIEALGLKNITLVIHDWGSGIGFHYAKRNPENVKAIAFMEAILRNAEWEDLPPQMQGMFRQFRTPDVGWEMLVDKNMFIEMVMPLAVVRKLTDVEMDHYRAPFTDPASRKPVWKWPQEVPIAGEPAEVAKAVTAYNTWLQETEIPKIMFYATPGALITEPVAAWCKENMKNLTTVDIGPGVHYVQEDNPHAIGENLAKWYAEL